MALKVFFRLDKDSDGYMSKTEARPLLRKTFGESLTRVEMEEVWRMADVDKDGRLTREEVGVEPSLVSCL